MKVVFVWEDEISLLYIVLFSIVWCMEGYIVLGVLSGI